MDATRRCPRCPGSALVDYLVDGVTTVDYCSSCRGLWCDADELRTLLGEQPDPGFLPLPFGDPPTGGPVCPACGDVSLKSRTTHTDDPVVVLDCAACHGIWLDGGVLSRLRSELSARRRRRRRLTAPATASPLPARSEVQASANQLTSWRDVFDGPLPYDDVRVNVLALPITFLLALVINKLPVVGGLLLFPVVLIVHEFGHAVTAWLGGFAAVPLPMFGFAHVVGSRSLLVELVLLAGLCMLAYFGWQTKHRLFAAVMGALVMTQIYLTWGISKDQALMWMTYGGSGGEIVLTTCLIAGFYYRVPGSWLRWGYWRTIVLIPMACLLLASISHWREMQKLPTELEIRSTISHTDGPSDIARLFHDYGWTTREVIDSYLRLSWFCIFVLVVHYVGFGVRPWLRQRNAAPS